MPRLTTQIVGRLQTLVAWEEVIAPLSERDSSTSKDGTGLMWNKVVPAKQEGNDPMHMQGFVVRDLGHCILEIPEGAKVEKVEADQSPTNAAYYFVRLGDRNSGVSVHLHEGLVGEASLVLHGRARLCVRTWAPEGAESRTSGRMAWKNYVFYLDFTPWEGEESPDRRIVVLDPTVAFYTRPEPLMFGEGDNLDFATQSADWDKGTARGINQHIRVLPLGVTVATGSGPSVGPTGIIASPPKKKGGFPTLATAFQGIALPK